MINANSNFVENINPMSIFDDMQSITYKKVKKGEAIYRLDDFANEIFFIKKGQVKIISYSNDSKEITKAIYGESEFFGELGLVGISKRRGFAIAMEESIIHQVRIEEMRSKMKIQKGLQMYVLQIIGSRVLEMERRLESLTFNNSRNRVIEYLLQLVEKNGQRVGYEMLVRNFFTHKEIANMTATSRQTVTMTLNELRNKNLLTFNRRRLLIRDMDKLKEEARA